MDRRRFLAMAAAAGAAGRLAGSHAQTGGQTVGRDGVQLYWFSQLAAEEGQSFDAKLPEYLGMVAEAGFSGVETGLTYCATDESAAAFERMLQTAGLGLAGLYSGGAFHADGAAEAVRTILAQAARAKALGCPGISCNPDPIGREKTNAELANQAAALNEVGAGLRGMGLSFGIHTHSPEMSHNAREFRYNLDRTDPASVGLCADFHWMYRGGADPYALTERYVDRIVTTHLRNSVEAVWAEAFEAGDLDHARLRQSLDAVGYAGPLVVEIAWEPRTPRTRPPQESLKLSRGYLKEVFGL
jgi:sugar phosphate isomerase/epimerase